MADAPDSGGSGAFDGSTRPASTRTVGMPASATRVLGMASRVFSAWGEGTADWDLAAAGRRRCHSAGSFEGDLVPSLRTA